MNDRVWLPVLMALAVVSPLASQEISAPEPRLQSLSPRLAQPASPTSPLIAISQNSLNDSPAPESGAANTQPAHPERKRNFAACAPSLLVVEDGPNVPPLSVRAKFRGFYRLSYDPCRMAADAFSAGISQAEDQLPGYGQGAQGYGKRLGANVADSNVATLLGRFLLPSLLHDDPRYFRLGPSATFKQRVVRAILSAEWTRRDNGSSRFNYSRVLGDFMATSIGNVYYPATDRGASATFRRGATMIGTDSASALFDEFWPDIKAWFFTRHKQNRPHSHP